MKQRRIGTLTLGLTLILIGVAVPLSIIFKEKALMILKFMPLILVALGIEIIVFAIRRKDEKIVYDGLSIFFAIVITIVTLVVSSVSPFIERGVAIEENRTAVTQAISNIAEENDIDASNIYSYLSNDFGSSEFLYFMGRDSYSIDKFKFNGFVNCRNIIDVEKEDEQKAFTTSIYELLADIKNSDTISLLDSMEIQADIYLSNDNFSQNIYLHFSQKELEKITQSEIETKFNKQVEYAREEYKRHSGNYNEVSSEAALIESEIQDEFSSSLEDTTTQPE